MANEEHLARLKEGVEAWNQWRAAHRDIRPDLTGAALPKADLRKIDLIEANLEAANLDGADLQGAELGMVFLINATLRGANLAGATLLGAYLEADLQGATLTNATLTGADLRGADLTGADLEAADLRGADLTEAHLSHANLRGADLEKATLVETDFKGANLTGCKVYGIAAWNVNLVGAQQSDLVIPAHTEPMITVDNVAVAQFIYLLLHNEKIRDVIDTITSKAVLILGRFTPKRKGVLDAIREALRQRNYLPILFDFEKPASRNFTETISTLAHMARFIIADLTQAKSLPQELQRIVPDLPSVPVQPILQASAKEYDMFPDFKSYPWVLETYRYKSLKGIITALTEKVITPAELKAKELIK
jgi:uncharacterized protein YjbI with pentapeptide repeats